MLKLLIVCCWPAGLILITVVAMSTPRDEFYQGLKAYYRDSFPKYCKVCGRVYATLDDFLDETSSIRGSSGLNEGLDELEQVVEVFRNCRCGSTLMDVCSNRRDTTDAGLARRRHFDEMVGGLVASGLDQVAARLELKRYLRNEPNRVVQILAQSKRKESP